MIHCGILTGGIYTVVTAFAANGNALVIKHSGSKTTGVMAHPAILGCGNVSRRLAYGERAVMAGCAIAGDVHMIEDRWSKRRGGMAEMTILGGWYMVCRRILAGGVLTVVTAFTRSGNALVIKHTAGEIGGVVTHPAILGSRNMRNRFTNSCRAVMTAGTITGDAVVTEDGWTKRRGGVAKMTVLSGWHMDHC